MLKANRIVRNLGLRIGETVLNSIISLEHFIRESSEYPRKSETLLIGIDGCGTAEKDRVASALQAKLSDTIIVHMDDFLLPTSQRLFDDNVVEQIGAEYDWQRLTSQVLEPIAANRPSYYQRYNGFNDNLEGWHNIPVGGIAIIEGTYSTRRDFATFFDFKIWVDCPIAMQSSRGSKRNDKQECLLLENNWLPAEVSYYKNHKPHIWADLVVDKDPTFILESSKNIIYQKPNLGATQSSFLDPILV